MLVFLSVLLFSSLCIAATNEAFSADFKMYAKGQDTTGFYYSGKMTYYYDSTKDYSFRQLTFELEDGQTFKESYVCAAHASDTSDKVYMRLNDCKNSCKYTALKDTNGKYYGCDHLIAGGAFGTNYYIQSVKRTGNAVSKYDTLDNTFVLSNYKSLTWSEPNYFQACVTKNCFVQMDFVFSIDASGSMNNQGANKKTRMASAKVMVESILNQFNMKTSGGNITAIIIKWIDKATVFGTHRKNVKNVYDNGFISSYTDFKADLDSLSASGGTCLGCGYKAIYEISYANYLYEAKLYPDNNRIITAGKVGFLLTDGEPTYTANTDYKIRADYYQYDHWKALSKYKDGIDCTENTKTLVKNAQAFYSKTENLVTVDGNNRNFFNQLTIIMIGAYEAQANSRTRVYYETMAKRAIGISSTFTIIYSINDLSNESVMRSFYNGIKADICSAFSGEKDNCDALGKPCCNGLYYCPKTEDKCKISQSITKPSTNPNQVCKYSEKCQDLCDNYTCNPNTGACIRGEPKWPTTGDRNPCYNYECKNGAWSITKTKIDCLDATSDSDPCHAYECKEKLINWNSWKTLPATDYCEQVGNICEIEKCILSEPKTNYKAENTCIKAGFTWKNNNCYNFIDLTKVAYKTDCKIVTCVLDGDKSVVNRVPDNCDNKCEKCVVGPNKENLCQPYSEDEKDPCHSLEDPNYLPLERPTDCWTPYVCDRNLDSTDPEFSKGACTPQINKCDLLTDGCNTGLCHKEYEQLSDGSYKVKTAECYTEPVECFLPWHLSSECYSTACVVEKGGCMILIDFDKLNDCGDCGEYTTCDESKLVISAAIGAGAVAAIVVVAVIALSVGLIASKKMYDMISGANEARMDSAQENALYQSADTGGANPLFD